MITTAPRIQLDWFQLNGFYAAPKEEYRDLFQKAIEARRKEQQEANDRFMEKIQAEGAGVHLTEAQRQELLSQFDPKHMTSDEYFRFVDKLCEYGILSEEDKPFVQATPLGLIPVDWTSTTKAQIIPDTRETGGLLRNSFSGWNGNVLGWADYRSKFQTWDFETQTWTKDRETILFGKIRDVLDAIA